MEAEALTTYTSALADEPEAIDPEVAGSGVSETALADSPPTGSEISPAPVGSDKTTSDKTFESFGIAEPICAALAAEGITTAFPIQALTLPVALAGHDLIGQARTGTGKTLAFGVPILQRLDQLPGAGLKASPRALVVVPTRELAIQVAEDLQIAGRKMGAKVVVLYGGRAYEPQIEALASVDIVVGTPGRLLDLVRQHHLNLSHVHALVLDEADKMLDLGFLPDVERILSLTPDSRQTMLFSATMPGEVVTLARRHLSRPMHIRAEQHDEQAYVPSTQQFIYRAHQLDKIEVLARVLQAEGRGLSIVFCRTKRSADQVAGALTTRGFAAAAVHGDLGQGQRERAMRAFRAGKVDVLVATDVAARGLDVDDVTHVVNYECPEDEKAYLHRIGRTGRAGRTGVAVTFVDWNDLSRWKMINDMLALGTPEPAETYSTSDHLRSDLGIAAGVSGTLPRAQRERLGLEAEQLEDIGETGRTRSRSHSSSSPSRSGSRRGGSGRDSERGPARGPAAGDEDREPAKHRQRVRRRLRSGVQVAEGPDQAGGAEKPATDTDAAPATGPDTASPAATATASRPRRRRRRSSHKPASRPAEGTAADGGTAEATTSPGPAGTPSGSPADGA
ncbi:MAG TPA: DEAD/DEAH box helicase [Streptosporangiaceae bacterium]|jgi:superfamily II DNA/RNA helicase|nr:DEAD/DEAH box helicase [Streptosporangiaceae bacterium]